MERQDLKDEVFLNMALEISRLGTCCRLKVGCVLLRPDGGLAGGGYNGSLPGMLHCTPDTCGPGKKCLHTAHAEENAVGFYQGEIHTAYVSHEPCLNCTRLMARRGVKRVVFANPYNTMAEQEWNERQAIIEHFRISWENHSKTPNQETLKAMAEAEQIVMDRVGAVMPCGSVVTDVYAAYEAGLKAQSTSKKREK